MSKLQVKRQFAANFRRALAESEYKDLKPLKALGKVFGVSGTMVHYWAKGDRMPAMAQGVVIALKLAVNVEWLLTNRGPMRIQDDISYQGATLLSAFEGMTDAAKREVLSHAAFVADKFGDKLISQELTSLANGFDQATTRPN